MGDACGLPLMLLCQLISSQIALCLLNIYQICAEFCSGADEELGVDGKLGDCGKQRGKDGVFVIMAVIVGEADGGLSDI